MAGPISRLLQRADAPGGLDLTAVTSLLAIVVVIAFFAGIAYGLVAIPSQTQLQEDLPADVRGRVFGVLNMLVSVASFLPIIVVGPISDLVGTTSVIFVVVPRRPVRRAGVRAHPRAAAGIGIATGNRPAGGRPDRRSTRRRPANVAGRGRDRHRVEARADRHARARRRGWSTAGRPTRPTGTEAVARVAMVFTGGTISTVFDPVAGGNVPVLDGAAILARTPGLERDRRDRRDRSRPDGGQSLHVSPSCSRSARSCATRWRIRRSTGRSSSRAPTRSRRPASAGTSCWTARSPSS